MSKQYQHIMTFRIDNAMMAALDNQVHAMGSNYSDTIRLALTLLFSRKLRGMTGMTTNTGSY